MLALNGETLPRRPQRLWSIPVTSGWRATHCKQPEKPFWPPCFCSVLPLMEKDTQEEAAAAAKLWCNSITGVQSQLGRLFSNDQVKQTEAPPSPSWFRFTLGWPRQSFLHQEPSHDGSDWSAWTWSTDSSATCLFVWLRRGVDGLFAGCMHEINPEDLEETLRLVCQVWTHPRCPSANTNPVLFSSSPWFFLLVSNNFMYVAKENQTHYACAK